MDISAEHLKNRLSREEDLVLVDVREDWEFEELSICSTNIPLYDIPHRVDQFKKWKDKNIVVFCKTGKRGHQAQKFLLKQGLTNVLNLSGGLEAYLKIAKV